MKSSMKPPWIAVCGSLICGLFALRCGKDHPGTSQTTLADSGDAIDTTQLLHRELNWELTWESGPFVGTRRHQNNHLRFEFVRKDPISEGPPYIENFEFWPFMKVHGHGAGGNTKITRRGGHIFEAQDFIFTMSGPWELEIRYRLEGEAHALSIPIQL